MNKKLVLYIGFLGMIFSCSKTSDQAFSLLQSEDSGITFQNTLVDTKDQNILDYLYYYNGGGVAIGDINNDGLPDIYFTSNQNKNALYLNKGNLQFEDITATAKVAGKSDWNTGVAMADVNNDGLLDIYVCAVVGINGFDGYNELFINNGDNTFSESAGKYGLDFDNYSSSAAFFDYDLDGDLDLFLLNHAVHTEESYGKASVREKRKYESGDKLLENQNGKFVDVSEKAGIFGGPNGYGLGVAISDFNVDGHPDIYISNDFHEDDYYYVNNGDGTFTESVKTYFGHLSKFSMGSDVADINHDGYPDLLTLDMLPDDENILKSSAGDDNLQLQKIRKEQYGYHYQYSRNMLQINQQSEHFTEAGLLSGIAATDWSWSALFADYNQDGQQDVFISNGIPKRPNDLDYIRYISNSQIKKKLENTNLIDQEALSYMPEAKLKNRFYQGEKNLQFKNQTENWVAQKATFSTGAAYGDLDNDGDLDLVTNNINDLASIYINNTKKNYLKLDFKGIATGAKAYLYHNGNLQFKELYSQRGFQSSSEPMLHFGLDTISKIDSLKIVWTNKSYQLFTKIEANQTLEISANNSNTKEDEKVVNALKPVFTKVEDQLGLNYTHEENPYIDVNRHKLIPYQISDRGPALAVGDLNNDGKEDVYFGSSKFKTSQLFYQTENGFIRDSTLRILANNDIAEEVDALIVDINNNATAELITAAGGGEFFGRAKALNNTIYNASSDSIIDQLLPENHEDTSVLKLSIDQSLLFVGNSTMSNDFGKIPESYVLKTNTKTTPFPKISLGNLGMVRDAIWTDFNNDSVEDLIVVGEWMQPTFLQQTNGTFKDVTENYITEKLNGLWRSIISFDIDDDGDEDYLVGNWGTNSKFKASKEAPMQMYYADFDKNEKTETLVAIEKDNNYYTLQGLDELSGQLVSLTKKKFTTYKDFAGKPLNQIIEPSLLEKATRFEVHTLQSGILKNEGESFSFQPFTADLQVAPINCFTKLTINGKTQVLSAGNYFGVTPYHGRFDGFSGALITNETTIENGHNLGLDFFNKAVTNLETITINKQSYLIATINNDDVQVYKIH
jgi:hypothetical protein